MSAVVITSTLDSAHKGELERLLFFNRNQARLSGAVTLVAQRYGPPRVSELDGQLRVELEAFVPQTLFAVHRTPAALAPVGAVVYTREEDAFLVLFVAIHEDFTTRGPMSGHRLMMRMTDELRAVGRRVKGVRSLVMFLGRAKPLRLAI